MRDTDRVDQRFAAGAHRLGDAREVAFVTNALVEFIVSRLLAWDAIAIADASLELHDHLVDGQAVARPPPTRS